MTESLELEGSLLQMFKHKRYYSLHIVPEAAHADLNLRSLALSMWSSVFDDVF